MFNSSFRGASLPLALLSASLGLALAGCGGGSTNLPTPGSGEGTLGGGGNGGGNGGVPNVSNNTIVFVSTRDGNPEIYSINANGTNPRRLTTNAATDEQPSRSTDGSTIVFSSQRDGNPEIYKMNSDGSSVVRLTSDDSANPAAPSDTNPVFSPDGSKIVWQSTRAISAGGPVVSRLYIMDASGANQRPVIFADDTQGSFDGSWNPDNARLLGFLVNPNDANTNDLAIITPGDATTGAGATSTVIRSGTRASHARYSPAGARIVLSDATATGQGQLQLLNADGTLIGAGPSGGVDQSNPSFNPQGTRVVWDARAVAGQNRQLYVSDTVTGSTQPAGAAITTEGENYQASWTQ